MPPLSDTEQSDWKDDYISTGGQGTNTPADTAGNINAELDDHLRMIKGAVRRESQLKPWIRLSQTAFKAGVRSFGFAIDAGDLSAFFPVGRRVRVKVPGLLLNDGVRYGYVTGGGFGEQTYIEVAWERIRPLSSRIDFDTYTLSGDFVAANQPGDDATVLFMAATTGASGFPHRKYALKVLSISYSDPLTTVNVDIGPVAPDLTAAGTLFCLIGDVPWVNDNPFAGLDDEEGGIEVSVGVFVPGTPSGHPNIAETGSFLIPGNASTGPFEVTLARPMADATYDVRLQVTSGTPASTSFPTAEMWMPYIYERTTTTFKVKLVDVLAIGETLTVDYLILR